MPLLGWFWGAKLGPKSVQNVSVSFFGSLREAFLLLLGGQVGAKIGPGSYFFCIIFEVRVRHRFFVGFHRFFEGSELQK